MRMSVQKVGRLSVLSAASILAFAAASLAQEDSGFAISTDGKMISGDPAVGALVPRPSRTDTTAADIQVRADGLGVRPSLQLEVVSAAPGTALVQSRMNYPAWIKRAEVRVLDLRTGRITQTVAIAPNGTATLSLPSEGDFAAVHRVYDAAGRYDETVPVGLSKVHAARTVKGDGVEEGADSTARRRIPITGGAVTVSGTGLAPGAIIQTLGETIRPDASGTFVLQRILPPGDQAVPVRVDGGGQSRQIEPVVTIPKSDWFYVATADLTLGRITAGSRKGETYTIGRLAYYANGKTANGWEITSSADTGESDVKDLLRDFDEKDPLGLLSRLDPDLAYPTYGDDSSAEVDAPTNGKFYLRAERDGSHLMWGNYKGVVTGAYYLRNERTLYGAQGLYVSPQQTSTGEPRIAASLYAAQPDRLPGRDVFRGTGGSVYFLQRQDISIGSETLSIEVRDPVTGRVISQRTLVEGRDYQINYLQGLITLSAPLSASTGSGTITPAPGSAPVADLVAQYEYTPTTGDIDGFAYGGRIEAWVTDRLRFGVTGMVDQTDTADQTATGADIRYEFGTGSFIEVETARSEGPGFGKSYSADGGLIIANTGATAGTGSASRINAVVDLADLGLATQGTVAGYFEDRGAGFSTLDYQTSADETLWGLSADIAPGERLSFRASYDTFTSSAGRKLNQGSVEATYKATDRITLDLGVTSEDRREPGDAAKTGQRTDLAVKLTQKQSDALSWYVFGQQTLDRSGGRARNDRLGAGIDLAFADHWTFGGELSGGTAGAGGRALFSYEDTGSTAYFGYTLDPGRELGGVTLNGRDAGQYVVGGTRRLSDAASVYAENTYDLFGRRRSLTSAYGVDYQTSRFMTLSGGLEFGRVEDTSGTFDRRALSLGLNYENDSGLSAKARLELRRDRGSLASAGQDADTVLFAANATYKISDEQRLMFSADIADSNSTNASILSGEYAKATLGYAFRPVSNDRLNLLARYTYLRDMFGQRVDGSDSTGPRQESHVLSVDATYDLDQRWTVGGKLGLRLASSSPNDTIALASNDAGLAVVNARYHLTHKWDLLVEARYLKARQAGFSEFGALGSISRQVGQNLILGAGYNFGSFSDDLTDLTQDDQGLFLNLVAKF